MSPFLTWNPTSSGGIKLIFPIAYKKGNEFEILPEFIPERKDEIWGYEIMPNIILAKKCSADGDVKNTSWYNAKAFAEECILDGKQGHLPSVKVLQQNRNAELRDKIQLMDKFLYENGIDAETKYLGAIWCSEVNDYNYASYFVLKSDNDFKINKAAFSRESRLSVAFFYHLYSLPLLL